MPADDTADGAGDQTEYIGSPEEAFSVLGDETRLAILLELADAAPQAGLSFSELRKRTGIEDSGRFNYHLDKLSDGFIEKSDGEYAILLPGLSVVSAVYAGVYSGEVGEHTTNSGWQCMECDRTLEIRYEQETLLLVCAEHGQMLGYPTPPGAYSGRSLEELADVVFKRAMASITLWRQGICPECWGPVSITYPGDLDDPDLLPERAIATELECQRCWFETYSPLRTLVASMPLVQALYHRHGLDTADAVFGPRATIRPDVCAVDLHDTEPVGATLTVELGSESVVLELDEECRVVDRDGY
jgi:hypothetical protein